MSDFILMMRFVVSFAIVQVIAVAGCLIVLKRHRRLRPWLAAGAAAAYLNCAYVFLFIPLDLHEGLRALVDYGLMYPYFTYMLICLALAPLFAGAALLKGAGWLRALWPGRGAWPKAAPDCDLPRRNMLKAMAAGVAGPVALPSLYGMYVGSSQLRIDEVDVFFPDLHPGLEGFTIAQISDIHVGPFMDSALLQKITRRISGMAPDLIAITGDIINWGASYIDEAADGLAGLSAEYGVYGVLGNHDFYSDTERLCARLEQNGVQLLRNGWRDLRIEGGAALQLAGIDDPQLRWTRDMHAPHLGKALRGAPEGAFRLLLSHRPTIFETAARMGCRLTLSGHTHAGQIIMPFSGAGGRNWSFAKLFYERDYGLFEINGSYLYINRGLGVVGPPLRINCPREITRLVLRKGEPKVKAI